METEERMTGTQAITRQRMEDLLTKTLEQDSRVSIRRLLRMADGHALLAQEMISGHSLIRAKYIACEYLPDDVSGDEWNPPEDIQKNLAIAGAYLARAYDMVHYYRDRQQALTGPFVDVETEAIATDIGPSPFRNEDGN